MATFKFKITLDRHNGIQNLNYYDLPDPPRFSLPSTFNKYSLVANVHAWDTYDNHVKLLCSL